MQHSATCLGARRVLQQVDSGVSIGQPLRNVIDKTIANGGYISDETAKGIARFSHERPLDYFVEKMGMDAAWRDAIKAVRARKDDRALDDPSQLGPALERFRNCNGAFSAHQHGCVDCSPRRAWRSRAGRACTKRSRSRGSAAR